MFNPTIYKAFNPDLANFNNNKLLVHWKSIGKKENRISCFEDFFKIYPNFKIDDYKKIYFNNNNVETLYILVHKHLNNPNNDFVENITETNKNINDNKIIENRNTIDIDKFYDSNNEYINNILNENNNYSNQLNYTIIFINNDKNTLTNFIQYIYSNINFNKTNILLISDIKLDFYEKLYNNLKTFFIKEFDNDYIDKIIKNLDTDWLIFYHNFTNFSIDYRSIIENDIMINDIKYIEYNLNYNTNIFGFHNIFFKKYLYFKNDMSNIFIKSSKKKYINRNSLNINKKNIYNCFLSEINNFTLKKNKYNKKIIIEFEIKNFDSILKFIILYNISKNNNYNIYIKNNKIKFLDDYNYLVNNEENLKEIYHIDEIKSSNDHNIIIKDLNIKDLNNYYSLKLNDNFINFKYFKNYYRELNFFDINKKIIIIFIDKNIYNNDYNNFLINSLTKINFKKNYIIIVSNNNKFIKSLELFNDISYIFYKDLNTKFNNTFISDEEIIIYLMLMSNYIIMNECSLFYIVNYLNINSKIFVNKIDYNKVLCNNNIYFSQSKNINIDLNNKIINICFNNYIIKNKFLYPIDDDTDTYYFEIIYMNFYILNLIDCEIKYELVKFNSKINYINKNYNNYSIVYNKISENFYKKINNDYELLDSKLINNLSLIYDVNTYLINKINNDTNKTIKFKYYILYISENINNDDFNINFIYEKLYYLENKTIIYFTNNHNKNNKYLNPNKINIINNNNSLIEKLNIFYNLVDDKSIIFYIKNLNFYNINNLIIEYNLYLNNIFLTNEFTICNKEYFKKYYNIEENIILSFTNSNYQLIHESIINENIFYLKLFLNLYEKNKSLNFENNLNYILSLKKDIIINYINNEIFDENNYDIINFKDFKKNNNYLINKILIKNYTFNKSIYFLLEDINISNDFLINNDNFAIIKDNRIKIIKINSEKISKIGYLDSEIISNSKDVYNFLILKCKSFIKIYNYIDKNNIKKFDFDKVELNINEKNKILYNYFYKVIDENKTFLKYYFSIKYNLANNIFEDIAINIINIKNRIDKLKHIQNNLLLLELNNYNFFDAIVPKKEDLIKYNFIKPEKFLNKYNINYVLGSTGCKLSHYYLLKKYLNSNNKYLMILEDDALIEMNFKVVLNLALMNIDDFDILYLSVNLENKSDAQIINPFILKISKGKTTTGYIVKIKNIQNLLNVIENSYAEIDNAYSESNLKKYCVNPMILSQKKFKSDINEEELDYGFYNEKYFFKI